jgi:hypothetical protein
MQQNVKDICAALAIGLFLAGCYCVLLYLATHHA